MEKPLNRITWTEMLMRDVRTFHAKTDMRHATIGNKAIRNPRFFRRLEAGGTITLAKADQIYDWMARQGYVFNLEGELV